MKDNRPFNFCLIGAYVKDSRVMGLQIKNKKEEYLLPWYRIKTDMEHFRKTTTETKDTDKINAVIMGYHTWKSLNEKTLKDRVNIVLSRNHKYDIKYPFSQDDNMKYFAVLSSLNEAIAWLALSHNPKIESVFIIGGAQIYEEALNSFYNFDVLYITEILSSHPCFISKNSEKQKQKEEEEKEIVFPKIPEKYRIVEKTELEPGVTLLKYQDMSDTQSDENNYLNLLRKVLKKGEKKDDRTGIGTLSLVGQRLKFRLYNKNDLNSTDIILPLLTTKKMFLRGIILELLMFIRGDVNTKKHLADKEVKIWEGNTSREFLDKIGLQDIEEGSLGKGYSFQWRSWGSSYTSIDTDHKKQGDGIDQLKNVIDTLKSDPYSRRIILSAWNVSDLNKMALPPCHILYQFIVSNKNGKQYLNCVMTQRSADLFLGEPFNTCSTALLTILISKVVKMIPGKIVINIGDAHIYNNAIDQCKTQIVRIPYKFPKIFLKKELHFIEDLENLSYEDFQLTDYHCHPPISATMAV